MRDGEFGDGDVNELAHVTQPGMHIAFSIIREGEPRARCQRVLSVPAAPCWPALPAR